MWNVVKGPRCKWEYGAISLGSAVFLSAGFLILIASHSWVGVLLGFVFALSGILLSVNLPYLAAKNLVSGYCPCCARELNFLYSFTNQPTAKDGAWLDCPGCSQRLGCSEDGFRLKT